MWTRVSSIAMDLKEYGGAVHTHASSRRGRHPKCCRLCPHEGRHLWQEELEGEHHMHTRRSGRRRHIPAL